VGEQQPGSTKHDCSDLCIFPFASQVLCIGIDIVDFSLFFHVYPVYQVFPSVVYSGLCFINAA
jgi:hypothetical protein